MQGLPIGKHRRRMLLCKVASGTEFRTKNDHKDFTGPPAGYDSVHGEAGHTAGRLNYDEVVVYEEEAILPYAIVVYGYEKKR